MTGHGVTESGSACPRIPPARISEAAGAYCLVALALRVLEIQTRADMRDPRHQLRARMLWPLRQCPTCIPSWPQVDTTAHITGVRFLTEEEWLAHRDAQQANSRLITDDVSDAVVIDPQEEH
jgi:hypothetical protein